MSTYHCMWWKGGWCQSLGKQEVGSNSYCDAHHKKALALYAPNIH